MRRIVRKAYSHVHVTYKDHNYTNSLSAENFAIDANDSRVIWSMDFSVNERTRNKETNSFHDVVELQENSPDIAFFQIFEEKLIQTICAAIKEHRNAPWSVEIVFKNGTVHRYPAAIREEQHIIHMDVI